MTEQNLSSSSLEVTPPEVGAKLADKMRSMKLANQEEEIKTQAQKLGLNYVNLVAFPIAPEAVSLIPESVARAAQVLCFLSQGDDLKVAVRDPQSQATVDALADLTAKGYKVAQYLISPHSFQTAIEFYKTLPKIRQVKLGVSIQEGDLQKFRAKFGSFDELAKKLRDISVTDLVAFIIASGLDFRSSDIHLECEEQEIKVRFRVDGLLHDIASLPKDNWHAIASRIKLLSGLKINVNDKPQDGSFSIKLTGDRVDVRTSTIPTNYGESIVMRLLMSSASAISFDDLGLRGKAYADLAREIQKPNGMIITTGPTGSGKTTTLYAVLQKLNNSETKIITLEDPIEYKLEGINQSHVETDKGYTFAKGLRSILRQDPDVIMVGEIRDLDTAETAINAALTGHLVISTLHTNSAAGAIPRFLSMKVKPFLLAPALNAMVGQRLVRRICPKCKTEAEVDSQTMSQVIEILSKLTPESGEHEKTKDLASIKFYKGAGCEACQGLGYQGRVGIYEVMSMTPEIEKMLLSGEVSEYQMQDLAVKNGTITMVQDGLLKALEGITTVEEVFRVAK